MAKIENTTVYPLVTPNASDYVIGTDSSNNNRTVSFSIADIGTAAGGLQDLQSVLGISGAATLPITLTGGTGNIVCTDIYPGTITAAGGIGTAGQILSSTGSGIQWINSPALSCCTLEQTLTSGNSTTLDIDTTGSINMSGAATALAFTGGSDITLAAASSITTEGDIILGSASVLNLNATSVINDATGAVGSIGQILTVNAAGTGVEWSTGVPVASIPTLQQVLTAGDTANANPMNLTVGSTLTLDNASNIVSAGDNSFTGTNTFSANGALVTTAGVVLSGSLWDGASTGTAGQVLTSTATGVSWAAASIGTQDLQSVLAAGNTATNDINLTGSIIPTTITDGVASVGASAQYLSSTGTGLAWANLPAAVVSSVAFSNTNVTSSGPPIVISPTAGNVVVEARAYGGGALTGYVPDSGSVTEFLQGDGTWAVPGGGAVTSVSQAVSGTSTGPTDAISVTPTVGLVTVASNAFDGSDKVGHVPDASGATAGTDFLRADGSWVAAGRPEWVNNAVFTNVKFNIAAIGNYYINAGIGSFGVGLPTSNLNTDQGTTSPITIPLSDAESVANIFQSNPGAGVCTTAFADHKLCVVQYQFFPSAAATYTFQLWKMPITGGIATEAGSVAIAAAASTLYTGTFTLDVTGNATLSTGEGFFLTVRSNTALVNELMQLRLSLKYSAV